MNDARSSILDRIRKAVAAVPPDRRTPRPDVPPATLRQIEPTADLVKVYCEQATTMGLMPSVVAAADLGRHVAEILRMEKAAKPTFEPGLPWADAIRAAIPGATPLDPARGDDTFYGADVGITGAVSAIAETGSLVVDNVKGRYRSLSLIPPLHVVIIKASQIVADLVDLFGGTAPRCGPELPSNITIITGPSKTADIEGVLVTGIHGPCKVYVVVISGA